ncbi:hypothetical protein HDU97_001047 [Phlyctochytrium planicorne]|nr:hypothetical protein HDU97_001047 [Phlyctochytrium planicorne]
MADDDGAVAEKVDLGDPSTLKIHLERLLPVVLDADPSDIRNTLFTSSDAMERLKRFSSDHSTQALYILKEKSEPKIGKDDVENGRQTSFTYSPSLELTYTDKHVSALVLIKRAPVIESTRPLQSQLQIINLPGPSDTGNAFETLHSYIHNAVSPFFDAFIAAKASSLAGSSTLGRDEKDSKTGVPMAKKKIAELELSLLQLQQNVEIPEITLAIDPNIQSLVDMSKLSGIKPNVDSLSDKTNDSQFLNKLQNDVNGWIKEIQRVTKFTRDPSSGTASQEINFWLGMERALAQIEEQLKSEYVVITLEVLRHAKRFHATVSFLADTGLKEATEKVQKYNQLMRDFPLNELLSATDIDKIRESILLIFGHLNKKLKLSPYPIRRALPLVGAISEDLNEQLLKVLGSRRLMYLDYAEFEKATSGCEDVFKTWEDQIKEFTNVAREVSRKRSEKVLNFKNKNAHSKLQERINFIRAFRRQHEQLHNTILKVMKPDKSGAVEKLANISDVNALDDVNLAYESVKSIDVLDVSVDGTEIWVAAENTYNERVARVENQIIARLRDRLGTAKNANEMFRVFSKFNALFVRPKIRGAIQEYQTQLIENVKDDIKKLHDKFKMQYRNSEAYHMSQVRDLPPVSGAIIWAKQIEHQLGLYMKRVEDVLGKGWELYAEGQKLQSESNAFRKKLETRPICDQWLAEITKRDLNVSGRIFEITRNRALGNQLSLGINFDSQIITLFKEVRNLLWFGYPVPLTVANVAKDAKRVYPFAVSLNETVRTYTQTISKVNKNPMIIPLVASYRKDVQTHISKGIQLRWDYFVNTYESRPFANQQTSETYRENRHVVFVREFASIVSVFQDKVNSAISIFDEIKACLDELRACAFSQDKLQDVVDKVQRAIDRLNLESYSNLDSWTTELDSQMEEVLVNRLQTALQAWVKEYQNQTQDYAYPESKRKNRARRGTVILNGAEEFKKDDIQKPIIKQSVHEIRLKNQSMYLDPSIELARQNFYDQLHDWLLSAYGAIDGMLVKVSAYVNVWMQYQSLWDLESEYVYSKLGEDLAKWQQLVLEIKKARGTFDNSETEKSFGVVVIDYEHVQSKVNQKYDQWQKEILNRFGAKLGVSMKDFFAVVSKARSELEMQSIEGNSTAEAVGFITFVQDLKRKVPQFTADIDIFRQSQKVLERQRYLFPSDWLFLDNVEGEWSAFNEILSKKNSIIQEQIGGLQIKTIAEEKIVKQKIEDIISEWNKDKPVRGDITPGVATAFLSAFEIRVNRIKEEYDLVCRAREALDLDLVTDNRLDPLLEELRDLKGVWLSLSQVWNSLVEIKETLWSSVVPRKTKQQLEVLITSIKEMPNKMRQYAAFDHMQETLKVYLKINSLLSDLKSEAMRDRHWKQIFKILKFEGAFSYTELTLGHLWDADLRKFEPNLREVVVTAQGEMALEEFIRMVRETWTVYTLELVNYQNKCRLIKGWDDLFAKCAEHLNSLSAMKHSPYYRVFEEEAASWEDKLNRIHLLFDVWIDVQRQWVYLEGIFSGNTDIKQLLPIETSRFQSINLEFMNAMKKVYKSPLVLDVLNVQGIQKSLERLADLLSKIQKALGEYLERERSAFPRFYFVGDEDLLDIIGNSKDIMRIQKHFKKMFAGISRILVTEDSSQITGLVSKEGEEVHLKTQIIVKDHPRINDWLTAIEKEMKRSLALLLQDSLKSLHSFYFSDKLQESDLMSWIEAFPAQLVVLSAQAVWTEAVEKSLKDKTLEATLHIILRSLTLLADIVLRDLPPIRRRKCEHLITELVHQRDVVRSLIKSGASDARNFNWLYQMRFYWNDKVENPLEKLVIKMANATFFYGYEYLGLTDRLVQTPLTDRCYLTMTQALDSRLGGSPFGPAGTGKTESVKALGCQLGRFVLVFCCDENFDFQAMGRIFIGLCQVGAWGCFDEFNRLEERILSAVSQQIQTIQLGLKEGNEVELVNKNLKINPDTGVFITMNPGYAGRSNLPDNLKKLFRSIAMTHPDRELIAQVMLYSQGFRTAEILASKVVPLFNLCSEQLSSQSHYDFGLRSLKSVLVSAGNLKRDRLNQARESEASESVLEDISSQKVEQEILIQSIRETLVPKLVAEDIPLLQSLLYDVFPGVAYVPMNLTKLKESISKICQRRNLVTGEFWLEKVIQLYQIQHIHHGLMMVGPSGSGKSSAWKVLLEALELVDGVEGNSYVIDPKAIPKDALYGSMDNTTREWTDGLFTHILRKIIDNVRGESQKRHWIIFDGDVDPEWVENLNSVLDDNKLLTLPNGERLSLPPNVRIMFEVENLRYATLATVSRCGMVWFSEEVVTDDMVFENYLQNLRTVSLEEGDDDSTRRMADVTSAETESAVLSTQRQIADILAPFFRSKGLVSRCLGFVSVSFHIMDFTRIRVLGTVFSLLNKAIRNILEYNSNHPDFPMPVEQVEKYISKKLVLTLVWSLTGDSRADVRNFFAGFLRSSTSVDMPPNSSSVLDFDVDLITGEWSPWHAKVPTIEIETHNVSAADVVIPTVDTLRHEEVLYSWLSEHKPLLLCGPPGSGKTMTLFAALRKLPDMEVVGLNFSSASSPELILKTFEQYCEYRKTPSGVVLAPQLIGRWLVLFCDEINLPAEDKYGTQRVISFIRQLVEHGGFWRTTDKTWVRLERIQFVGACNPPTDPGRVPLSHRFLRHSPLLFVDYPGEVSLYQIYSTFARAMLKVAPNLRAYSDPLTYAMIEFFLKSQRTFTPDIQSHYIYSPRELTRWVRGIFEVLKSSELPTLHDLVRLWVHEGLRLFQDRLVSEADRKWTDDAINEIAMKHFPNLTSESLQRPILFSNWISKSYVEVAREELRDFVKARLKVFYEEELDVPIVLFNDVLDHVLRIDRVFRQMQGHLLLIGVSGAGKIKVHNKYSAADFDEDLRNILRRAGCKGEKICFIMDESNVLDAGFLERMNTLLANAEIPGLFEGDEYSSLMTQCKEGAQREGLMLDSTEELYKWFTHQVMKNLHIVFTMNPPEGGLASRAATSPALFNRCVLDWFGDWSDQAFYQVGKEFTDTLDLDYTSYQPPAKFPIAYRDIALPPSYRVAIINAFVYVHQSLYEINSRLNRRQGRSYHVTPRHYLDFISHFVRLFSEKREDLEEQQRHLNVGLEKLRDTVIKVEELRRSLAIKKAELELKTDQANEKLKKMVAGQQEAEQQKASSLRIQKDLSTQNSLIEDRKKIVMSDLADAEPAVAEAQKSVSNIKKQHLTEVRAMGNPPEAVKIAMESVCILLGHKIDSWKTVQGIIRKDDFIASIVNYDTDKMTQRIRNEIRNTYLNNPAFNFEAVNRASKACGPLVQWVTAQVRYAEILERIGPLRQEVRELEGSAEATLQQATNIEKTIADLESSISHYKDEYAVLISETQALKAEMEQVKSRVDRSLALLGNLSSENERWGSASQSFESQMGTIVGDVMLSSAYLAYGGFFDQNYRDLLLHKWIDHLDAAQIRFKAGISIPEYLSTADDRLYWQENQLPADDLCTENAIMLQRFNRYPLIIDPSGQATSFLLSIYKKKKIMVTSFLDDSFLKVLESALRFGNPLLVQDVENLDPILNAVLNKEIRRTGGRVLIRLGGQDIDFSPSFTLFLSTRDPSVNFPPDICSRVTFVNFTVTRSSLQSQCLHQVLKAERPDTDRKRTDLIKLRGEFQLRLRHLEKSLLQALNESKGNILDDDKIIATLETLKQEAAEVTKKVEDTDIVMQEVENVTTTYTPLAQACSSIFFCLEQLSLLNHFYQFSLDFFTGIFEYILHDNPRLVGISDYKERLSKIFEDLFRLSYQRASRSLLHDDQVVFAIQLAQINARVAGTSLNEDIFDYLISDVIVKESKAPANELTSLFGEEIARRVENVTSMSALAEFPRVVLQQSAVWKDFSQSETPEQNVPAYWPSLSSKSFVNFCQNLTSSKLAAGDIALHKLLSIKVFRPDRLVPATSIFVESTLKNILPLSPEFDLKTLVLHEIKSSTPLAFCSVPGYDASKTVEEFAARSSQKMVSVAMGSAEGFGLAETAISAGIKSGIWVLLKNVHLSPGWLSQLEKKIHSLKAHDNFRLFLTMETHPKVPVNLLRLSRVLMFEPPPGIKANLSTTLSRISSSRYANGPVEKHRLYFLLAWLHAIVQERLRYVPLGWTKAYEFNEADYDMALTVIDSWLEDAASGRTNIAPEKIPWDAIKSLLTETVYGGKLDNAFDQVLLESFVNSLFGPFCFDLNFSLVSATEGGNKLVIPEATKMEQIVAWVSKLPEQQPPSWLGLPSNAERVLMTSKGNKMLSKIRRIKLALDDFETIDEKSDEKNKAAEGLQPSWMKAVNGYSIEWLEFLPQFLPIFTRPADGVMDPLLRFFEREHKIGASLLKAVRDDLQELKLVCEGKVKQTNNSRQLIECLSKGTIPSSWKRYKVSKSMSLLVWISDLKARLDQLSEICKSQNFRDATVWLGGLFLPEAFTTATRQDVSQRNGWSLEELSLRIHISDNAPENSFAVTGLRLTGAEWKDGGVKMSNEVSHKLQKVSFEWAKGPVNRQGLVPIPAYLNEDRSDLLFVADLAVNGGTPSQIIQHSVSILAA